MKTCLVNLFDLDPPRNGGLSRVAYMVSNILAEYAQQERLEVFFAVGWRFSDQFRDWLGHPGGELIPVLPEAGQTPLFDSLKPDIVISPLFGMMPVATWEGYEEIPHIASIPDALALDKPGLFQAEELQQRRRIYDQLQQASAVVTLSQDARRRLIRHLGLREEQVAVIPLAGDLHSHRETGLERGLEQKVPDLPKPYVFYPANGWPHKRHDLLMRAMRHIWQERADLALVLTGWHDPDYITDLASRTGCPLEKIVDLGYVSNADLVSLYSNAEALLFVSEYEGFGMPLLEAMQNGCPVICAPLTSIPEVAGDAALYVSSDDPTEWAKALLENLPLERERLVEAGYRQAEKFSWQKTQDQWRKLLEPYFSPVKGGERAVSISAFLQEFRVWAHRYGLAQEELVQKEEVIGNLSVSIKELSTALQAKDTALQAKEKIIQDYQTSVRYWLLNGPLGRFRLYRVLIEGLYAIRRFFLPRVGVVEQYPPCRLEIPASYYKQKKLPVQAAPTISIVTPSYNQAQFLPRTIASVLDQDYPKLEYIIQDGGSTDGTIDILEGFRDRLTHVESRRDKGQANAVNLSFRRTSGEIMAYLNSDDVLLPGALWYVANYFKEHPDVDVVYSHRVIINEGDAEIGRWVLPPHDNNVLLWADYVPQETMFWRRRIWEQAGGCMDENFQFALDWDLLVRFHSAGAKIKRLPRFLAAFRAHASQKNSTMFERGQEEMGRLRRRVHGRDVEWQEILKHVQPYLRRSVIYHKLYRLGVLRY